MNIKAIQESLKPRGFALVVTVSLLILLTLIAVGLLTLSSISLRSSASSSAMAEARANARLAMMMAVGQLQALGGLDTRVTASSSLVSGSNVPVTGVWRSWEGSDRDNTGKPIPPDYRSKNQPGDPSLELEASGGGRFLGWLTSTAMNAKPDTGSIPDVAKAGSANLIAMVSKGSVEDVNQEVHMKPTRRSS